MPVPNECEWLAELKGDVAHANAAIARALGEEVDDAHSLCRDVLCADGAISLSAARKCAKWLPKAIKLASILISGEKIAETPRSKAPTFFSERGEEDRTPENGLIRSLKH